MIDREKVIPSSTIDKNWVLGHFLDAIYSLPELRQKLVFKGGIGNKPVPVRP